MTTLTPTPPAGYLLVDPQTVRCPICWASVGLRCTDHDGERIEAPHVARIGAAARERER